MKSNDGDKIQCPCCKECKDCNTAFQKVVDLKNAGLVIYRHTIHTEDVNKDTGIIESATKTTEDVFILHNTKDMEITSADFLPEIEQNKINCPRCRRIIEHAQKLLQKVPTINRNDVKGICEHCRTKDASCFECEEVVKKFVASKTERAENTKERVKQWLSKIKYLLKDAVVDTETGRERARAHSELYIDQLCRDAPKPAHEPDVRQMFHPEDDRSNFIGAFPPSIEKRKNMFAHFPRLEKLERPVVFIDSSGKEGKQGTSRYTAGDLSISDREKVYGSDLDSEDLRAMFHAPLTEEEKRKKDRHVELREYIPPVPFQSMEDFLSGKDYIDDSNIAFEHIPKSHYKFSKEPDMDLKHFVKMGKETRKDEISKKHESLDGRSEIIPVDFAGKQRHITSAKDVVPKQDERAEIHKKYSIVGSYKTVKGKRERTDERPNIIRKYHSEEALLTAIAGVTGNVIKQDFSYVFPKVPIKDKKMLKRQKSSSELIKDTQDMLLARAEDEKNRLEEERKKKLAEEERKMIAREERKKELEAKKKAEEEKKRLEALEKKDQQKIVETKIEPDEKEKLKKDKVTPTVSTATSKTKMKESRPATEKKESKPKEPKEPKTPKESIPPKEPKPKEPKEPKTPKESMPPKEPKPKEPKEPKTPKESMPPKEPKPKEPKEPKVPKESMPPKEPKPKEPKVPKEPMPPKEPKEPKESKVDKNDLKAEKDAEKAKKEQEKKEKEERQKKEKEEKDKLKKEKDEQQRIEKEMNQKEKDYKQREKDEKSKEDKQKKKEKDDTTAKQKELDNKAKQDKENAEKREREEARLKLKAARDAEKDAKPEPEKPKVAQKVEQPKTKDLNIKSIKVRRPSPDDLILQLVRLKQSTGGERMRPKLLADLKMTTKDVKKHRQYHKNNKTDTCFMCLDSDIELDAESLDLIKDKDGMAEIIIGPKIFKYKPPLLDEQDEHNVPLLFQSTFDDAIAPVEVATPHQAKKSPTLLSGKHADQEVSKGVIRYALSDRSFIDKGWTMLPTEKVVRKMNVYRMRPAHPEFDWFEHNKNKRLMQYDTGEKLAEFDDNGRGRWFYRNGRMALDYYDAEELNAQQRFVIYSSGEPDERGRAQPYTLLATFDYLGNGIVFDHGGKIRLKYNQTEGVVLDRSIGPVSHWKWHTLNDPPVLQQVMIDTQMAHKDPGILKLGGAHDDKTRPDNEDMLAIEFDNFIKEKSKKLSQSFKPFQIKMKALKINEHFSLKVLDQATVYLIFRDGTTNLKLNIGMVLDHKEIVDTDTAEVGEVSNNMERLPARTDSLAGLQRSIAHAQHYDRTRTERDLRLRPIVPCGSADRLVSAASRAMRPPLRTGPSGSTTTASCYCKCSRKPTASNIYYDTRLC